MNEAAIKTKNIFLLECRANIEKLTKCMKLQNYY